MWHFVLVYFSRIRKYSHTCMSEQEINQINKKAQNFQLASTKQFEQKKLMPILIKTNKIKKQRKTGKTNKD